MKKVLSILAAFVLVLIPILGNSASASPGRTDANGGHTCRTNCAKYGLKTGQYHYHNSDGSVSLTKPGSKPKPAPKPAPKPVPAKPVKVQVYINNVKQSYDQPAVIENGRTLVPLRGIFESLGATVNWDGKKNLVTAKQGGTTISLKVGSKSPMVNGKVVPIDVPAKVTNGRTLVPLRFVSESLGATVKYDGTKKAIYITSKK